MIVVKLQGGLGNQLFQYATAKAVAMVHQTEVAFDGQFFATSSLQNIHTPRQYELNNVGIAFRKPSLLDQISYEMLANTKIAGKFLRRLRSARIYAENKSNYTSEIFEKTTSNTYLKGFFQSERYFLSIRPILLREILLDYSEAPTYAEQIMSTQAVSLHIRRGDYISLPAAAQFHGICSLDYYSNAIDYIQSKITNPHIYVFSDEIDWAKNKLKASVPLTFVDHANPVSAHTDLSLMHLCKHHILANSTYSWWGAWLNPSPKKIVIAPKIWFADHSAQEFTDDLLPASWIRLA
ncbi:alpha-1,2-fucosyltransferase [Arundinibacter roseus]|uniref:Alpha-1,2-fucosyltransferase n=1 Tax=Arundinibacter roseus TaxID=2070510 RepID=A0A4R4K7A8_9BACT|nr:alpha-1,2-fucosyltransferase [Arundinibacter roseus]TDB63467.1 alpha-1,2-fucosyltransferase [Arundinibacter roseus]